MRCSRKAHVFINDHSHIPYVPTSVLNFSQTGLPDAPYVAPREPVLRNKSRVILATVCDRLAVVLLRVSGKIEPRSRLSQHSVTS